MLKRLALFLLLLTLTGCSLSDPEQSDIVGQWVERTTGPSGKSAGCATIEFLADGRFEARGLPEEYFILANAPATSRVDAFGEWSLVKLSGSLRVELEFDPNPNSRFQQGYTSELHISAHDGQLYLYAWAEDEADQLIFDKGDATGCTSDE